VRPVIRTKHVLDSTASEKERQVCLDIWQAFSAYVDKLAYADIPLVVSASVLKVGMDSFPFEGCQNLDSPSIRRPAVTMSQLQKHCH
jgi:hypothetical protein